jgi:hypothetical protein
MIAASGDGLEHESDEETNLSLGEGVFALGGADGSCVRHVRLGASTGG